MYQSRVYSTYILEILNDLTVFPRAHEMWSTTHDQIEKLATMNCPQQFPKCCCTLRWSCTDKYRSYLSQHHLQAPQAHENENWFTRIKFQPKFKKTAQIIQARLRKAFRKAEPHRDYESFFCIPSANEDSAKMHRNSISAQGRFRGTVVGTPRYAGRTRRWEPGHMPQ